MRVVIQKVSQASVTINDKIHSSIAIGLLILAGFEDADTNEDILWCSSKICNMRIFGDDQGKMNFSLKDIKGQMLVVSQFTLQALSAKGNRPSFVKAARPDKAIPLYEDFLKALEIDLGETVMSGVFGADMKVQLVNDGPVTIILDSKKKD